MAKLVCKSPPLDGYSLHALGGWPKHLQEISERQGEAKTFYRYIRDDGPELISNYRHVMRKGRQAVAFLLTHLPDFELVARVNQDPELGLAIAFFKPV